MKKLLISLALLTILAAPLAALAQSGPAECCSLRRAITIEEIGSGGTPVTVTYARGAVVSDKPIGTACGTFTTSAVSNNWGIICLINTFNGIVDWVFVILIILVVFFTILGAFLIVTASGKAENVTNGKNYILYAAIGLAVAFLARAIPGVVKAIAGF